MSNENGNNNIFDYTFREADGLGVNSNLDLFVDREHRIVWLRAGMNNRDRRQAAYNAARMIGLESPTTMPMQPVPLLELHD